MDAPARVAVVVGTRPEAIKMAPVVAALRQCDDLQPVLVASGQHRQMLDQTLAVFGLTPDIDLDLMRPGQTLPDLTARAITAMAGLFEREHFDAVLVQGDTTTVLATAMAAFYARISVGHVEAGLRTGTIDSPFPEEMNRRLTSPLVRWHFCPTACSRDHLLREGHDPDSIEVTGNTVIDALLSVDRRLANDLELYRSILNGCGVSENFRTRYLETERPWILMTGHRRESFGQGFENICHAVRQLTERYPDVGVLYPVHLNPQVREPVQRLLGPIEAVELIEPVDYLSFVALMRRCTLILTDSGGVQEEAPSLGKPAIVLRESTERPEAVAAGTATLVGTDVARIVAAVGQLLDDPLEYRRRSALANPYGDGQAAARIIDRLRRDLRPSQST